jgi:Protein of unknown function (DUF1320)
MYVQKTDYKGRISIDLLDLLLAEDEANILTDASKTAEDTIASQVNTVYSVNGELAKTGAARNFFILNMAVSIALYYIYQRADDNDVPEKVIKNYDDTMDALAAISKGKQTLDLPAREANNSDTESTGNPAEHVITSGKGLRRWGSNRKRSHMP